MFFKKKQIQTGDTIVITYPCSLKAEVALTIEQSIKKQFPDNRVIVLGDGADVKVVRPS